ncbi:MAG: dihydrofolate reductase family protein [Patescibacteria group bacterium]
MQVSLLVATSVDGRIAREASQLADWTSREDKKFFVAKSKAAGVVIMGRTTYETIGRPLPNRLNVVLTRDTTGYENQPGLLEYSSKSPRDVLAELDARGFKDVVIGGGSSVYSQFLKERLVTDLYITVESLLFGAGIPFVDGAEERKLHLVSSEQIGPESVLLHYQFSEA